MSAFFRVLILLSMVLLSLQETNQNNLAFSKETNSSKFDHLHSTYNSLLKRYVHNGKVNYTGFISSSEEFNAYLKQLASLNSRDYKNWSRNEKLAFWINAYNAFTIKAVINHYPIQRKRSLSGLLFPENSIRQIDGIWDKLKFSVLGKKVTLSEIEHKILRKEFKEPRIHFAIVCASRGCPDLRNEAYIADKIDKQLEDATTKFINNPQKGVRINLSDKTVGLSKIFKWFEKDFTNYYNNTETAKKSNQKEEAVISFIKGYIKSDKEIRFLETRDFTVYYLDYDWRLNE
ncbi:hypothetical protein HRbin37_02312 [bacterium HR37]|nr:hypothetical protein HRbin37_02312 [bacterium HR37]